MERPGFSADPQTSLSVAHDMPDDLGMGVMVHEVPGVFYVAGELDASAAEDFEAAIAPALDGKGEVVLDLTDLTFIDSMGVRTLARLSQRIGAASCSGIRWTPSSASCSCSRSTRCRASVSSATEIVSPARARLRRRATLQADSPQVVPLVRQIHQPFWAARHV